MLASNYTVQVIAGTEAFLITLNKSQIIKAGECIVVQEEELASMGSMETNNSALAVVEMKHNQKPSLPATEFTLVLDDIRDPGNLGTIIRTADWYGIKNIVASPETTDHYNPKVINTTMGSFLRVDVFYTPLEAFLSTTSLPTYGAFLEGESVHSIKFSKGGLLVVGNEARGISPAVEKRIRHRITIPRFGHAESLNASTATAIILDNVRRQS